MEIMNNLVLLEISCKVRDGSLVEVEWQLI